MKGDYTKFFGGQQYEMNSKFGSYLPSTTCISLFCIPSNIESSESWFALYLSLFELLSQKSWSRRLKKTSQHPPVIRTNYWSHTPFNTHRKRTCQEDWLQFLHSIWNDQMKLRTYSQCETHLPALDMINSWSERGKSDRCMKTRNLRKYHNLFINGTHLASLGSWHT